MGHIAQTRTCLFPTAFCLLRSITHAEGKMPKRGIPCYLHRSPRHFVLRMPREKSLEGWAQREQKRQYSKSTIPGFAHAIDENKIYLCFGSDGPLPEVHASLVHGQNAVHRDGRDLSMRGVAQTLDSNAFKTPGGVCCGIARKHAGFCRKSIRSNLTASERPPCGHPAIRSHLTTS